MASIGLSKPLYAKYSYSSTTGAVTYSSPGVLGKYTELNLNLDTADDNILRADNGPAESDTTFSGGTVEISVDELRPAAALAILGLKSVEISGTGLPTGATWNVYDDDQAAPYVALGGVVKKKVDGGTKYVAVVFDRVKFQNPNETFVTQGESVEWQVPSLTATIFRSEAGAHPWHLESSLLDSEADAIAIIEDYLDVDFT